MMPSPAPDRLLAAGIGDMVMSGDPGVTLIAYGLGSCIGLSAWDSRLRFGGLAHFMLPQGPPEQVGPTTPVKFIQGGLERFLAELRSKGVNPARAQLKAVGGASMLQLGGGGLEIGKRNGDMIIAALSALGLRLAASDMGGRSGRTVQLEVGTGRLFVKSVATVREI
jgi:chemotaxis protein CheD